MSVGAGHMASNFFGRYWNKGGQKVGSGAGWVRIESTTEGIKLRFTSLSEIFQRIIPVGTAAF